MSSSTIKTLNTRNQKYTWLTCLASFSGDYLYQIAYVWIAWQISHSAIFTGAVATANRIPFWLFGIFAGVTADRFNRKNIAIVATVIGSTCNLLIFIFYALDIMTPISLIILVFLNATAWTWENPAMMALFPQLIEKNDMSKLNHLVDNSKRIAGVVMPTLSIYLATQIQTEYYFILTAFCFFIASVFIFRLTPLALNTSTKLEDNHDNSNEKKPKKPQPLQTLKASFAIFFQYKLIVIMVLCSGVYYSAFASGIVLVPILIETNYQIGLDGFSTFLASQGLGALLMNLCLKFKLSRKTSHEYNQLSGLTAPFYGFMIVASCLLMVALSDNISMLIVFGFLGGCGLPLLDIYVPTLIQKVGQPQHHGRLFAIWRLFVDLGMSIGFIVSGFIAEIWQANYALAVMAVVVLPVTIYSLYRFNNSMI